MRILIVQTGSTVPGVRARRGDFDGWFRAGLGLAPDEAPAVRVDRGEPLPDRGFDGVVVTGSPAMVTERAAWSERCAVWLRARVEDGVAVLGVCYGHQLLAHAFGGRVGDNPRGREIGTVSVALTDGTGSLFEDLPPAIVVQATHRQSVLEPPDGAHVLAGNDHDPVQAFAIGTRAWGVQFHPEFDADIVRGYLDDRAAAVRGEGLDPDALRAAARDSDHGAAILRAFRRAIAHRGP